MKDIEIERLRFALFEEDQNFIHINHALKKLEPYLPLDERMLDDPDIVEHIDQMIFRWIKIQDSMGRRLIPLLVEFIVASTDEFTFIDKLNTLEKRGLIERSQWHILRSIRNQLTHIYPEDRIETIETIHDALDVIQILEDIYKKMKIFSSKILADASES